MRQPGGKLDRVYLIATPSGWLLLHRRCLDGWFPSTRISATDGRFEVGMKWRYEDSSATWSHMYSRRTTAHDGFVRLNEFSRDWGGASCNGKAIPARNVTRVRRVSSDGLSAANRRLRAH